MQRELALDARINHVRQSLEFEHQKRDYSPASRQRMAILKQHLKALRDEKARRSAVCSAPRGVTLYPHVSGTASSCATAGAAGDDFLYFSSARPKNASTPRPEAREATYPDPAEQKEEHAEQKQEKDEDKEEGNEDQHDDDDTVTNTTVREEREARRRAEESGESLEQVKKRMAGPRFVEQCDQRGLGYHLWRRLVSSFRSTLEERVGAAAFQAKQ